MNQHLQVLAWHQTSQNAPEGIPGIVFLLSRSSLSSLSSHLAALLVLIYQLSLFSSFSSLSFHLPALSVRIFRLSLFSSVSFLSSHLSALSLFSFFNSFSSHLSKPFDVCHERHLWQAVLILLPLQELLQES